jgi:phosphohistidine phosphatase
MKKLIIVRHAKSSWDNPLLSDFDRPLNKRGEKDAPRMAKRLKERKIVPDVIITSPAIRALTTCREFCKELHYPADRILQEKNLYHATEDQILSVLKTVKDHPRDSEEVVVLFGHNPGLTDFANALLNEEIENIPTCGIVGCTISVKNWRALDFGSGHLDFFDFPKRS